MTNPKEPITAITNLEQDPQDLGWRPVDMVEERTGVPFTRWFPPHAPAMDRGFMADQMDFPPNSGDGVEPLGEGY